MRYPFVASIVLLVAMLSGCVHRQFITQPYPRWGEEIPIHQADDASPLLLRILQPTEPSNALACLLLVHGMNEYMGRYSEIARYFAQRFIVAGFDLYAHGLSNPILQQADRALIAGAAQQEVGDAYLAQIPLYDLEPMKQDLSHALKQLIISCDEQGESDKPIFIVSHSLGSLIAASYLLSTQNKSESARRVQGIILLGPAFSVTEVPGWRGWLANPLIKLSFHAEEHFLSPQNEFLPLLIINQIVSLIIVPLLDGIFEVLSWPGLRTLFTPATPDWVLDYLTDSEHEKARIRADGWFIRRALLRYVKAIETEIIHFRHHMSEFAIPYYLIFSGRDPITPSWGSEDFAQLTLQNHPDNELLPLPKLSHHEHLFSSQPLRNEILKKIEQWLDRRRLSWQQEKMTKLQN
ncbi:alpha/beta fold hydrolase [Nitrosomonas communis]|uniref:Lysophospholipase, alpha-beta hydrolase superfamily n=1 Tax=Nitrosomonas communis TaxID=44574 RepID=A0A1H2WC21_9PROT|nr:alpha/beta hydrolase [Nitrosomonas communis]SDW77589.1 Lysophospholipase, alpha-beta hydrolase superfamily [Nitrosomonas communis]